MKPAALRIALLLLALLATLPARATFHLWSIAEIFSSADGKVQFIEFVALDGGQQFLSGHNLVSGTKTYNFTSNLPGDTAGRRFLVGTTSFAALGVVQPDYVVPDNFLNVAGGTLVFAGGADDWDYPALPTNGTLSLLRDGTTAVNSPRNFANATGSVNVASSAPDVNVQGLWYASPAESESGWGLNLVQQGTVLFVTWFTYGTDGRDMWLHMSDARRTAANTYSGTLYRTTGPAFNAVPFNPQLVTRTDVGSGTLTFTDGNNGSFSYTVNGISQVKPITRVIYASPVSVCTQPAN